MEVDTCTTDVWEDTMHQYSNVANGFKKALVKALVEKGQMSEAQYWLKHFNLNEGLIATYRKYRKNPVAVENH